ncbi:hypothetical protein ACJ41O_003343 [Fusarium nematophilum]
MINNLIVALGLTSAASAAPLARRDECQDAYKACVAAGTSEVACSCTLMACVGEDNARNREYCASATASLAQPTKTEIPGGCNPAHPGSCPSSYFTYTIESLPAEETFTSVSEIPGGCNPAHPGPCPSSYFTYPVASETTAPTAASTSNSGSGAPTYPNPVPVDGKTWSIVDLTRYCGEDNSGCDYNFAIEADGKTERCTVIRMPGADAATESWSEQPCTDESKFKISWGYVTEPAPAFAVVTVVKGKELAWFGVSDVNGQKVTPSSPFGSGQYGNVGPEQVYTY